MKKARRRPKNTNISKKVFRKNLEIKVEKVRYIDPDTGINSVLSIQAALKLAEDEGLDLVEVSPNANPPVVKLLNFDSFRYQQKKLLQKQKAASKTLGMKGMRLSVRIDAHDLETKAKQGAKFLEKGHKVKIDVPLRGRENQHVDLGIKVINDYIDKIQETVNINVEQKAKKSGRMISAVINKKDS